MNEILPSQEELLNRAYQQGRADQKEEDNHIIRALQKRCFALSQGAMCMFCKMDCGALKDLNKSVK